MNQLDDIKKKIYQFLNKNNYFNLNSEKIKAYFALFFVLGFLVFLIYNFLKVDNERSAKIAENLKKRGVGALRITAPRPSFLTTDDNGNLSKFDPSGKEKLNNDFRIEGQMEADGIKINGNLTSESVTSKGKLDVTGDITSTGKLDVTGNITSTGVTETKQLNVKTNNPAGGTHLNFSDGKNYLTGDTIVRGGDITSTGKLTVSGDITSTGKLSVSGDTDFQGGTISIKTKNPAGGTHFNWSDGKNYLTGDTIVRGGKFCIGNTCMSEQQFAGLIEGLRGMSYHLSSAGGGNVMAGGDHYRGNSKFG